ncbi:MAG: hypothetical protein ACOYJZ_01440 [Acutalibacter sp.]
MLFFSEVTVSVVRLCLTNRSLWKGWRNFFPLGLAALGEILRRDRKPGYDIWCRPARFPTFFFRLRRVKGFSGRAFLKKVPVAGGDRSAPIEPAGESPKNF